MDLHPKQLARVNVKTVQSDGVKRVLNRSFSVDPRTITLDRLQHLVARALHIKEEFFMLFTRSKQGGSCVPMTCDWDLEGALAEETCLDVVLELKPKEPGFDEWDIITPADVPVAGHEASCHISLQRKGSLLEQVIQLCQSPSHSPVSETEFWTLADWPCPLRYAIFRAGGADPSVRPHLWLHLLDAYPPGSGSKERDEFLNEKSEEYYRLRYGWQKLVQAGTIPTVLEDVINLVRKDVRRTDRGQSLDDHALYNVLITYAVHHPSIGYCQGMSDLLSPLLHVFNTEARAYIAFCGLMKRMRCNFRHDGRSISTKFRHLRRAIRAHDLELYEHLDCVGGLDLLFCYRWLLLDLKREFQYEEMLRLMEVLWSSFPPVHSEKGVGLFEERFPTPSIYDSIKEKIDPKDYLKFEENHFGPPKKNTLKRWAILSRRQSIAKNMESEAGSSSSSEEDSEKGIIHYRRRRKRRSRNMCRSWSGKVISPDSLRGQCCYANTIHDIQINNWVNDVQNSRRRHGSSDSNYGSNLSEEVSEEDESAPPRSRSEGYTSEQESQQTTITDLSESDLDFSQDSFTSAETYFNNLNGQSTTLLPPPTRLFDGKPFLLFLCLTMILNHRDTILMGKMDGNEIGIYFDRLVRKHKLSDVMPKAKEMFQEYLLTGWTEDD